MSSPSMDTNPSRNPCAATCAAEIGEAHVPYAACVTANERLPSATYALRALPSKFTHPRYRPDLAHRAYVHTHPSDEVSVHTRCRFRGTSLVRCRARAPRCLAHASGPYIHERLGHQHEMRR